jgi:hypothetical protein
MSKQSPSHWKDNYSSHHDISIRNEYTRFACMFYLFTIFAFLSTILLIIFANNSYHNESESIQRRFIPYSILGSISLALFFIFFIGSLAYTSKLIKKLRLKQTFHPPTPLPRSIDNSIQIIKPEPKPKPVDSFILNTDESYYASTRAVSEQKSRTITLSSHPCQTDV